jgi:magnesium-transporting ATPase (P-type)
MLIISEDSRRTLWSPRNTTSSHSSQGQPTTYRQSHVFRSLFEQFRRLANVYFLLISVLMLIGTYGSYFDSPLDPWSTLSLLIIVLTISICKECAEDIKRHLADRQTNYRLADRLSPSAERDTDQIYWEDIKVGDLILLHNNHEIPADMIILTSSDPLGQVYLETSNIDGETSLKLRNSAKTSPTTGSVWKSPKDLKRSLPHLPTHFLCLPSSHFSLSVSTW